MALKSLFLGLNVFKNNGMEFHYSIKNITFYYQYGSISALIEFECIGFYFDEWPSCYLLASRDYTDISTHHDAYKYVLETKEELNLLIYNLDLTQDIESRLAEIFQDQSGDEWI